MPKDELRVFFPWYFPSVNIDCQIPTLRPSKFCLYPGLMSEIIGIIVKDANLTLIPTVYQDYLDIYEDLKLTDLNEFMQNDSLDTIAMAFQYTEQRQEQWDFSEYLYKADTRLIRRTKNGKLEQMWGFFQTYDIKTWTAFIIAFFFQSLFQLLVRRFEASFVKNNKHTSFGGCIWSVLRLQLLQPEPLNFRLSSGNLATFLFSFFQCSLLLGMYSSFILAGILTQKEDVDNPIKELIRSIASGEYYMVTNDPLKWFYQQINTSNISPYPQLRSALSSNPLQNVWLASDALNRVLNENAILFQQVDEESYFEALSHCDITIIDQNMPTMEAHLVTRKKHPLMKRLNETIKRNRHRFINLSLKYAKLALERNKCPSQSGYKPLTISPYLGLMLVCFSLFFIAFIVFCMELLMAKMERPMQQLGQVMEMRKMWRIY